MFGKVYLGTKRKLRKFILPHSRAKLFASQSDEQELFVVALPPHTSLHTDERTVPISPSRLPTSFRYDKQYLVITPNWKVDQKPDLKHLFEVEEEVQSTAFVAYRLRFGLGPLRLGSESLPRFLKNVVWRWYVRVNILYMNSLFFLSLSFSCSFICIMCCFLE